MEDIFLRYEASCCAWYIVGFLLPVEVSVICSRDGEFMPYFTLLPQAMTVILLFSFLQQADLSVFETNIRFVGGLLSAYALTGDQVKSVDMEMWRV